MVALDACDAAAPPWADLETVTGASACVRCSVSADTRAITRALGWPGNGCFCVAPPAGTGPTEFERARATWCAGTAGSDAWPSCSRQSQRVRRQRHHHSSKPQSVAQEDGIGREPAY